MWCTGLIEKWKLRWKWRDIQPSMVTHTRNSCSAFNPSNMHTHTAVNTHTPWTHTRSSGQPFYAAAPGEQLGVRCLAQGHLSRGIEGGESAVHSLPPPTIPAGPRLEPATFGLRVRLSNHWATTSPPTFFPKKEDDVRQMCRCRNRILYWLGTKQLNTRANTGVVVCKLYNIVMFI